MSDALETSNTSQDIGPPTATSSPKRSKTKEKNKTRPDAPLKVIVINFRSIVNKKPEFLNLLESTQADVIIGTETWLNPQISDSEICPPGYMIYRKDRKDGTGGGVFILIADKFISSDPDVPCPPEVEMVWAQLQVVGSKKLSICAFYRPPNKTDAKYLEALDKAINHANISNGHIWIGGDFNLDGIDWENSAHTDTCTQVTLSTQLIGLTNDHGLTQIVDEPTRRTENSATLLDLFFTNHPDMVNRSAVIPGLSDHEIPILDISTRIKTNTKKPRKVFQYHRTDTPGLLKSLEESSAKFCNDFNDTANQNVNDMWSRLKNNITQAMDKFIPSKTISSSKASLPWITSEIKHAIRKRDKLFRRSKETKKSEDRAKFVSERNNVQRMIRSSYWLHMEKTIVNDKEPEQDIPKNFWSYMKATKKDRFGTAPLKHNGTLHSDAKSKADILNLQYQSVFSKESLEDIPSPTEPETQASMKDITVEKKGVLKLLLNLKEKKASGPDNVPARILKLAAEPLSDCLTLLFNASLTQGNLPDDWKTANITPVFKKGERYKASNYRPVSLTCICSKMLEHIVVSNMMAHFDTHQILCEQQHGFRPKRSCETQLVGLTQELHEHLEAKGQVDMIVLDFSKAFDKVPHRRLLKKLWNYGIRGKTHKWINMFLTDRNQRVVVDGEASEWIHVESGVPQGTVLGPILFLAFINDLPTYVNSSVRLFADDCVLYRAIEDNTDCTILQEDLKKLEAWEDKWLMSFNASKCSAMSVTRKKKKIEHPYTLHNQTLETVKRATYLGVELTPDLSWKAHINSICTKANNTLSFIRRNVKIDNRKVRETAYKGLVRPKLEYYSPIWNPHQDTHIRNIEMVQRRAARFTLGRYSYKLSVTEMLKELEWETLAHRRMVASLILLQKIRLGLVAATLPPFYIQPPKPSIRHPHRYLPIGTRTVAYQYSFFPLTMISWNSLPTSIATLESIDAFKDALDSHKF